MGAEAPSGGSPSGSRPALAPVALALGVALVGGTGLIAVASRPSSSPPHERSTPTPEAAPVVSRATWALEERVVAASRTVDERLAAIQALVADRTDGAAAIGRALDLVPSEPVPEAQVRASLLSALGAFPGDPAARSRLASSFAPGKPREERLLALAVVASLPEADWAAPALRALGHDRDNAVRQKAGVTLARIQHAR